MLLRFLIAPGLRMPTTPILVRMLLVGSPESILTRTVCSKDRRLAQLLLEESATPGMASTMSTSTGKLITTWMATLLSPNMLAT